MQPLTIATAQFENKSADKKFNLDRIAELAGKAALQGARAIAFHECSVTGYTFARNLNLEQMLELAEQIPEGESIARMQEIAREFDIAVLAGLFEKDRENRLYNAYVCIDKNGLVAKHRKIHPFINPHLVAGNSYCIFELEGWKCGILICFDNNIAENVRAVSLLGADIIFMPHVTMCTPSTRPGAGYVDPELWKNRISDPTSLRLEFDGLKGRAWLMKWLPSRAYDNSAYVVFTNPVGMDDDQLKNGCSMIIDPFGDIIAECRRLGDDVEVAVCSPGKIKLGGGYRYKMARKPELYKDILGKSHNPELKVDWLHTDNKK
jgi:predicted amidohydrolase